MDATINFKRSSGELRNLIEMKLRKIEEKGLELDIKGLHYVEHAKRAFGLLDGIKPEYYTQREIEIFTSARDITSKYLDQLEKYTTTKDVVRF